MSCVVFSCIGVTPSEFRVIVALVGDAWRKWRIYLEISRIRGQLAIKCAITRVSGTVGGVWWPAGLPFEAPVSREATGTKNQSLVVTNIVSEDEIDLVERPGGSLERGCRVDGDPRETK